MKSIKKGFSVLEVVIATSILAMFFIGISGILQKTEAQKVIAIDQNAIAASADILACVSNFPSGSTSNISQIGSIYSKVADDGKQKYSINTSRVTYATGVRSSPKKYHYLRCDLDLRSHPALPNKKEHFHLNQVCLFVFPKLKF